MLCELLYITTLAAEESPAGDGWKGLLLPVGVALIVTSLVMSMRKRRKQAGQQITPYEEVERIKQQRGVRGDMEDLMVEVEQMAKRVGAQLDAKAIRLERLIDEADRRMAELQQHAMGTHGTQATGVGGYEHESASASTATAAPPTQTQPAATNPYASSPSTGSASKLTGDALNRTVCNLADQGLDAVQIARQLDEHVGKVELILALQGK